MPPIQKLPTSDTLSSYYLAAYIQQCTKDRRGDDLLQAPDSVPYRELLSSSLVCKVTEPPQFQFFEHYDCMKDAGSTSHGLPRLVHCSQTWKTKRKFRGIRPLITPSITLIKISCFCPSLAWNISTTPIFEAGNMSNITIVNNTKEKITVSITNTSDSGQPGFYEIASKNPNTWKRNKLQVCYVLRADNGKTEVLVVEPGKTYQIVESHGNLNMNEVTIVNDTGEKIAVSITNIGENGQPEFFEITSKNFNTWKRSKLQVCHVLRTDNGDTEVETFGGAMSP
ncbi:uncharacterized protein BJ212DRAFT_1474352 [Suillus subaureus]|uniref:Uncharacterized protein n=1 Tax=Suillus subaureus TaxID=48587 RepID=A0A9P7JKB3_9AGAM|nr:uncharacterized protein BJ212DRAFT_1474352 [Suillus subaureus]KAG1827172.1 hypothetical protein BJ212DRAFT_1474352 [Suillus subaureus]